MEYCPECGEKLELIDHYETGYKQSIHVDIYECPNGHKWAEEFNIEEGETIIYPKD